MPSIPERQAAKSKKRPRILVIRGRFFTGRGRAQPFQSPCLLQKAYTAST